MKRIELIQTLEKMGCVLIRHGGRHDWYQNPNTKMSQPRDKGQFVEAYYQDVELRKETRGQVQSDRSLSPQIEREADRAWQFTRWDLYH